jgi:hypothetical protein
VLFESYWPGLVLFGALALIFGFRALQSRNGRLGVAAALAAALAIAVVPLTLVVETTREALIARTRQLVRIAVPDPKIDYDALTAMTTAEANLLVGKNPDAVADGREQLLDTARRAERQYRVEHHGIRRVEARRIEPNHGQSFLRLTTALSRSGGAGLTVGLSTEWLIDWRRDEDQNWRITRITLLTIAGRRASADQLP